MYSYVLVYPLEFAKRCFSKKCISLFLHLYLNTWNVETAVQNGLT